MFKMRDGNSRRWKYFECRKTLWQDKNWFAIKRLPEREERRVSEWEHVIIDYDFRVYQKTAESNMKTSQTNVFWLQSKSHIAALIYAEHKNTQFVIKFKELYCVDKRAKFCYFLNYSSAFHKSP